jgi:hypothetical protein
VIRSGLSRAAPRSIASLLGEEDAVIACCNNIDDHHRHQWPDLKESLIDTHCQHASRCESVWRSQIPVQ